MFCIGSSLAISSAWWIFSLPQDLVWLFFRTAVGIVLSAWVVKWRWARWRARNPMPDPFEFSDEMVRRWMAANRASARWN